MPKSKKPFLNIAVALHPEGVDRNRLLLTALMPPNVALHPEGVDRNYVLDRLVVDLLDRRPPPGGRG